MEPNWLERAALNQFGSTYAEEMPTLSQHLVSIGVLSRINTGGGFFADLKVGPGAMPIDFRSPVDGLAVRIEGVLLEFLLFFSDDGYARLLEAYAVEGGDTSLIKFDSVTDAEIFLLWPKSV